MQLIALESGHRSGGGPTAQARQPHTPQPAHSRTLTDSFSCLHARHTLLDLSAALAVCRTQLRLILPEQRLDFLPGEIPTTWLGNLVSL